MDKLFFDWLPGLKHDKELRGVDPKAIELFVVKVQNLIKKGHDVERPEFYWTPGSQKRSDRGPYLRVAMKIDGKLNRFWLYYWNCGFGKTISWQNTTKQRESAKRASQEWLQ